MKITKVYTKTGDKGSTSLVGGIRIAKSDIRIEAYGTVDELNAQLGLLAAYMADGEDKAMVERVQANLFNVGTHLATDQNRTPLYASAKLRDGEAELLEREIDRILEMLPESQGFVLPGGGVPASVAHVCRTVCRRAERCVVALSAVATVGPEIQQYLNRLSDYLFVLAKKLNFIEGKSEKVWRNPCE